MAPIPPSASRPPTPPRTPTTPCTPPGAGQVTGARRVTQEGIILHAIDCIGWSWRHVAGGGHLTSSESPNICVKRSRPLRILRVYSSSGVWAAGLPRNLTLFLVLSFKALPGNLNFAMVTSGAAGTLRRRAAAAPPRVGKTVTTVPTMLPRLATTRPDAHTLS